MNLAFSLPIDNLQASTKAIKINDLILFFRSVKNSPELFILDRIVKEGFLIADIKLNFNKDGEIKNDYKINGFIKNAKLDVLKKNDINNLDLLFKIEKNRYLLKDIKGKFGQLILSAPTIDIKEKKNKFKINGKLITEKRIIDKDIVNDLFTKNFKNFDIKDIKFGSENSFSLDISKKLKISPPITTALAIILIFFFIIIFNELMMFYNDNTQVVFHTHQ